MTDLISRGSFPNDHAHADNWYVAAGKINDFAKTTISLRSRIISVGDPRFDSASTVEDRVQMAIDQADRERANIVEVGAEFFNHNAALIDYNPLIKMVAEGRNFADWDVDAYGADGTIPVSLTSPDGYAAFTAALASCYAFGGGRVYGRGKYRTSADIILPPTSSVGIVLCGAGMRSSYIYPSTPGQRGVLFGSATPDASGSNTVEIQYPGMEDISVNGSLISSGTNIGVQLTQPRLSWMRNVIIEEFDNPGDIGLLLQGSITSAGVGAPAAPHCWRAGFQNVVVTTTMRPVVVQNADEDGFYHCNFAPEPGQSSTCYAVEVLQGHNIRFYDCLASGDNNPTYTPNYRAFGFRTPTQGDNDGHLMDGCVAEGFKYGIYVEGSLVHDIEARKFDASGCTFKFWNGSDDGAASGERGNNVDLKFVGYDNVRYSSGRTSRSEGKTLPSGTTPSVQRSDLFLAANGGGTAITKFLDGYNGQVVTIVLDANTSITHGTGADNIRCPGGATITAAAHKVVTLIKWGYWETLSVSVNA